MYPLKSRTYQAALERTCAGMDLRFLQNRTVLISGAAGMLGSCLADMLCIWNRGQSAPCRIIALSRHAETAAERFQPFLGEGYLSVYAQDVCRPVADDVPAADYVIHAASPADPVNMAAYPTDTLLANVLGTKNLLDFGLGHGMERFVYISSGEAYGQPDQAMSDFTEEYCGPLDLSSPRSCYPEGKRAAEVLCQSYISQYGADVVIARPCHLFGPTMKERDSRAVSEFLRNAAAGRDIVMKSAGLLERSHCYVLDAAAAILLVLGRGRCGAAYNIADRRYQMTVGEFARRAAQAGNQQVICEAPSDLEQRGYTKVKRIVLDPSRMEALGWAPRDDIRSGIHETIDILRELTKSTADGGVRLAAN